MDALPSVATTPAEAIVGEHFLVAIYDVSLFLILRAFIVLFLVRLPFFPGSDKKMSGSGGSGLSWPGDIPANSEIRLSPGGRQRFQSACTYRLPQYLRAQARPLRFPLSASNRWFIAVTTEAGT
jgi:hypothetical protein